MQETHASGDIQSVYVRISSVAPFNLEFNTENQHHWSRRLEYANSLTAPARVADRAQASGCNRPTRLGILDRFL
eukprot:3794628-Pyramimonas_sp.AAC.1